MLKRVLLISILLSVAALLFYGGMQAMSWALAQPEVRARRPRAVISPTLGGPAPTQTHTATVPPTATRSSTALPTKAAVRVTVSFSPTPRPVANAEPTFTPVATYTPIPTFTPAPTLPSSAPTVRQTTAPPVPSKAYVAPSLLDPHDHDTRNGSVTFKWQPGEPLPAGAGYEVVWWPVNGDPNGALGLADPVTDTEVSINLDSALGSSQTIRWAVLVVNKQPYKRLTLPSESNYRELVYQPPSSGGGGDYTGPGSGK